MKYAFMSFSCPSLTLDEMLALATHVGYDGIEPRVSSDHAHGLEYEASAAFRARAREKAAEAGVSLCCIATSCQYANPEIVDARTADTHSAIDLAGDVGAPCIRVFGGTIPEGIPREEAMDRIVGSLASVADHAQERGVTVCMETHDSWCDPNDVAEVMRRVNHSAIAVNWDIMHPIRRGNSTMEAAYQTLAPWIRHIHFHDCIEVGEGKSQLCLIGAGRIDHKTAVALLSKSGYAGYLSGEWINWESHETHLPRELATMKGYEGDVL